MVSYYYPYWQYIREHLEENGELPLWNDSILCGTTVIGNAHFSFYYPPNLLFLHLPFPVALHIWYAFHIFISGLGCYLFLRHYKIIRIAAMYGALIFMLGAHMAVRINIGHYDHISVMAWIPFSFLFFNKLIDKPTLKNSFFFGVFFGIHLLTLHLQIIYLCLLGLTIFAICHLVALWKKHEFNIKKLLHIFSLFLLSGFIAVGLASAQLLYIIQSVPFSYRAERTFEMFSKLSLPPIQILGFFIPDLWGTNSDYIGATNYWELSCFIGFSTIFVLIMALIKRSFIINSLLTVGIITLLFSLGKFTPLSKLLYHMPFMSYSRIPARFLVITIFALAALSGFGLNNFIEHYSKKRPKHSYILIILISCSVIVSGLYLSAVAAKGKIVQKVFYPSSNDTEKVLSLFKASLLKVLLVLAILWILFFVYNHFKAKPILIGSTLIVLLFAELFFYNLPLQQPTTIEELESGYEGLQKIQTELKQDKFRVWGLLYEFQRGLYKAGIERIDGYEPLKEKYLYTVFTGIRKHLELDRRSYFKYLFNLAELSNTKYLFFSRRLRKSIEDFPKKEIVIIKGAKYYCIQTDEYNPRAFFADSIIQGDGIKDFYNFVMKKGYRKSAYTEGLSLEGSGELQAIDEISSAFNKVSLSFECDREGIVVLNDVVFPGWKAFLDDKETEIIRVNYAFRGIRVGPGKHLLVFEYNPELLNIGKIISLITVMGLFAFSAVHCSLTVIKRKKGHDIRNKI